MPRTIDYEAMLSPVHKVPTRAGNRAAVEVLLRDLTGAAPVRLARYVQLYSTDTPADAMRHRILSALRAAYGKDAVTTISSPPQWMRTTRFVFDRGEPEDVLACTDLPFVRPEDLAGNHQETD